MSHLGSSSLRMATVKSACPLENVILAERMSGSFSAVCRYGLEPHQLHETLRIDVDMEFTCRFDDWGTFHFNSNATPKQ